MALQCTVLFYHVFLARYLVSFENWSLLIYTVLLLS